MNRVLEELEKIITVSSLKDYSIKRVLKGTLKSMYVSGRLSNILSSADFPAVLLSPGKQRDEKSYAADHHTKVFGVQIVLFYKPEFKPDTQTGGNLENTPLSANELSNFLEELLADNKKLNGVVAGWSPKWDIVPDEDAEGNQLLIITTEWVSDLIPDYGIKNNQKNQIVDPARRPGFESLNL